MAERSIVVSATVPVAQAAAWDLLCDTTRYADWVQDTDAVVRTDGPAQLGSTYDERNDVLGPIKGSSHWTVVEHEPPGRTVHRGEGIAIAKDLHIEMALQGVGEDASELTLTFRYVPAFGLLGRLLASVALHRKLEAGFRRSANAFAALAAREHGAAERV